MSDKDFTHKLTVLMALLSASRASLLKHVNSKFMARNDMSYKFYFHKLHISWRSGKAPPKISYRAYTHDPSLCVVETLDEYISRTEAGRSGEECSQLFLSFVNPHKSVVFFTISDWLKNVLKKAGIDISTFKAHSTRSASSSKADLSGAPIEKILKRGCWSNKSTLQNIITKALFKRVNYFRRWYLNKYKLLQRFEQTI